MTEGTRERRPECDLIMKGGLTSGIVYPLAVARLASHYRLRSVGGASAGAIAAAAAAAAEYDREGGGFERLAALPALLGETDATGATRLFRLFQPQPSTRRLYALLVAGLMPERPQWGLATLRWLRAAVGNFPVQSAIAVAASVLMVWAVARDADASATGSAIVAMAVGAVIAGLLFALLLLVSIALHAARRVPANGYGLCSGLGDADALTPWLYATLQSLAGMDAARPLRFGDLWRGRHPDPGYIASAACHDARLRDIDLRLMTTALSHGRPYSFPLDGEAFCFDVDDMRALFPAAVVDALVADSPGQIADGPLAGRYRLPPMNDLPVIVAVRMSLAFPGLLSAVPLWHLRVDPDVARRGAWLKVAECVWFSDGGICSNFPIQYFDALLPSRPTFGINLVDADFVPDQPQDPGDYVWMPAHNGSGATTRVVAVDRGGRRSITGFVAAILETMQNWTDSTQLAIPGYRDRIVAVRLRADEGGVNLRMAPALIARLAARGEAAGQMLLDHYAHRDPPLRTITGWRNHRWVRYRVATRVIGEALAGLRHAESVTAASDAALQPMHAHPPSYAFRSDRQRDAALGAYRDLLDLADRYARLHAELGYPVFDHDPDDGPRPRPQLRIRPPL